MLNVFIHGDMPEKVQRICKLYNVTEADAINMINDTDKRRRTNYNFYTEQKWGMAGNYTLSLNSSVLGYEIIRFDTEIIIFHIAPVRLCKMFTVNCTLMVNEIVENFWLSGCQSGISDACGQRFLKQEMVGHQKRMK